MEDDKNEINGKIRGLDLTYKELKLIGVLRDSHTDTMIGSYL